MPKTIWRPFRVTNPAVEQNVHAMLVNREVARDHAERFTNPWLTFVSEFFAECKETGSTPWQNTGTSPMTFASQVYHERQDMQAAFIENGMWDAEPVQENLLVDPDQVFVEVDWDDYVTYQAAA